jgi:hypothetical protein
VAVHEHAIKSSGTCQGQFNTLFFAGRKYIGALLGIGCRLYASHRPVAGHPFQYNHTV